MPTAAQTLGLFKETFPKTLRCQFQGRSGACCLTAVGTTIWVGRALQISSIIGGSVAVSAGLITHLAIRHLGRCYWQLGGRDKKTLTRFMVAAFSQPVAIGGLAAAIAGHPISFLGRIALAGIFYGSLHLIRDVEKKIRTGRADATAF